MLMLIFGVILSARLDFYTHTLTFKEEKRIYKIEPLKFVCARHQMSGSI